MGIEVMKFSTFVCERAMRADLVAEDKESVIRELVGALVEAEAIKAEEVENIVKAILKREELGSTGIGRGVGVSSEGVDFSSLDGEKVHIVFLLVSPPDRPGDHLRALESISRQLRDDAFCRFLKTSKTAADIQQLLEEADHNQFAA
jgi:mannitol/fructose-specific phosphotransferase system IIA component (Ntr-type)